MTQWIITIAIVIAAFLYALMKIVNRFSPSKEKPNDSPCSNCSSDCGSCELAETLKNKQEHTFREASDQT